MRDMEIARSIMMSAVNLSHSGILDVFGGGEQHGSWKMNNSAVISSISYFSLYLHRSMYLI